MNFPFLTTASFNLKLIFGGRFLWFLFTSSALFVYFMWSSVWHGELPNDEMIFSHLFFPSLLLVFYPAAFSIQNDADARILEILFGIPGYMYKVWLSRLLLTYAVIFGVLVMYGLVAYVLVYPVSPLGLASSLMLPVLFVGSLSFFLSTLTRSGNATAILVILLCIVFLFLRESFFRGTLWDVSLNPYSLPSDVHPVIWQSTVLHQRLFLVISSLALTMLSLRNLQKREKFI